MSARVTLSTGSLYGYSLGRIFLLARELDLDGVELLLTDELIAAGPGAIMDLVHQSGTPILSVHFPFLGRRDEADFNDAYERSALFAAGLPGCELVVVHYPVEPSLHSVIGQAYLLSLRRAQGHLQGTGSRIAIENRGVGRIPAKRAYLDDFGSLRRLVEEWDLAITYDVGHAASWGLDPIRTLDVAGPRVRNIHLSDSRPGNSLLRLPIIHSHLRDHQPLGVGHLPIDALLSQLTTRDYSGLITLELSPISLHWPLPWRAIDRLAETVQRCRDGLMQPPTVDPPRPTPRPYHTPSEKE